MIGSENMQDKRRKVKAYRKLRGLTLEMLGERVGLSKSMLHHFENGKRNLSEENWEKIDAAIFRDEGHALERRFDPGAWEGIARSVEIISWLQRNIDATKFPKTHIWLTAEMEATLAEQRAMELAELAHEEIGKKPGIITLFPLGEGDAPAFPVSPYEKKPAPLRRLTVPSDKNLDMQIVWTQVWNEKQERELKEKGWRQIPKE